MPLLVDTGVIYAMTDRTDAWHAPVVDYLVEHGPDLLAPVTILPEVAYLVRTRLGPREERKVIAGFESGEVAIEPLKPTDLSRALELMGQYPELGFTDSTVVAMAERLALTTIATTDRRHFGSVRPAHVARLTLVP
jgi:predicted nucleic acid-binding protein